MLSRLLRRTFLLAFLLPAALAGCRSERVAFEFQPGRAVAVADSTQPRPATQPASTPLLAASLPLARPARLQHPAQRLHSRPARPAAGLKLAVLRQVLKTRPTENRAAHQAQPTAQGLGSWFVLLLAVLLLVMAGLAALVTAVSGLGFWAALGIVGLVLLAVLLVLGARGMLKS
jgi:hypothetical protein